MGAPVAIQNPFRALFFVIIGLSLTSVLASFGTARVAHAAAAQPPKMVVIDPGHGGSDSGAIGPRGTTEKGITLILAQQIREELGDRYRTVLTRSDDYRMEVAARTATANNQRADVFISLHAGGGYDANLDGISVQICVGGARKSGTVDTVEPLPTGMIPWGLVHVRHIPESRRLANILRGRLSDNLSSTPISLVEAPLAVLAGADMPSALIEIGYLTHPATELRLSEADHLADLARAIAAGIDDFFLK